MHFQGKMAENRRKTIFRDKELQNEVPQMILDDKTRTKR